MRKRIRLNVAIAAALSLVAGSTIVTWLFCRRPRSRVEYVPVPMPSEPTILPGGVVYLETAADAPPGVPPRRSLGAAGLILTLTTLAVVGTVGGLVITHLSAQRTAREVAMSLTGGFPERGKTAIDNYGCASCHTIPGIRGATALVGPPLTQMGSRAYVAGMLQNTPTNMIRWIQDPPGVNPHTAMPNLHVTQDDARDIATYLYTLQ